MRNKLHKPGTRVRVAFCSGIGSGRTGVVVPQTFNAETRRQAEAYPFCGGRTPAGMGWQFIQYDHTQEIDSFPANRLIPTN